MVKADTSTVIKADADDARRYWLDEGRAPGGYIKKVDYARIPRASIRSSRASRSSIATRISPSRRICGPPMRRPV